MSTAQKETDQTALDRQWEAWLRTNGNAVANAATHKDAAKLGFEEGWFAAFEVLFERGSVSEDDYANLPTE